MSSTPSGCSDECPVLHRAAGKITQSFYQPQCALQNGDKIVYSKFAGTEVELEGSEHVILKVRSIHAVLRAGF